MSAALPRRLGQLTATALVIASMMGTGVFTTSGLLLADLGSPWPVMAAWLVGGALAACGALSYGALARRLPESGGEYLFLSHTLHPAAGNMAGWISLLVGFSAPLAAAAFGFGEYVKGWFPGSTPQELGSLLLIGFALVHGMHVSGGAWMQNITVLLKVLLMLVFMAFAWPRLPAGHWPAAGAESGGLGTFAMALVWVSFSYSGWNAAVYIAGEVRNPERTLPRALLLGTGLVTLLYLALNAAFLSAAPVPELAGKVEVARAAAFALGGKDWADFISALVALALATSVSAMMMAGPRVYARMASDGFMPRRLAAGSGAPVSAIALQCAIALVLLWTAAFESLLTYIGFTLSLSTAATIVGLMCLKRREGENFEVPGWPWAPVLYLLGVLWMAVAAIVRQPTESVWGLATLAVGWLSWRLNRSRNASLYR